MTAVSGGCRIFPRVSRQSYRGSAAGTFFQWPGGNSNGISPADASADDVDGVAKGTTLELNLGIFTLGVDRDWTTSSSTSTGCDFGAADGFLVTVFGNARSEMTPVWRTSLLGRVNEGNLRPALFRFHRDFLADGVGGEEGSE